MMPMKRRISPFKKTYIIKAKSLNKSLKAPSSKSEMQRAVALAILANGKTIIKNPSFSKDSLTIIRVANALGASIQLFYDSVIIEKTDDVVETHINMGESGLGVRMFSSIVAIFGNRFILNGESTLLKRSVKEIDEALSQLNLVCKLNNGALPIEITGEIKPGKININGSWSSQVLTGLLIALPLLGGPSEISVVDLKSKPYIDLTMSMIEMFGGKITHNNYEKFYIEGNQSYIARDITIEGDWSSAAFLLVAGLISGKMEVKGLNIDSKQADKIIVLVIQQAGGKITLNENSIITEKSDLNAFEFDATNCPDLFPPLVSMATFCSGTSVITGTERLIDKESNRAETLKSEFEKIGVPISLIDNKMYIKGSMLKGATVESHNDHRVAMALAVAALGSEEEITILNSDCVNKSYPFFFRDIY
jgi:3-phosphoshikimate 1-carboxyvinyltransferase